MKNSFEQPDWFPRLKSGQKILVTGATGGVGVALVKMLLETPDCIIGAHGNTNKVAWNDNRVIPIYKEFNGEKSCLFVVEKFIRMAGGLDALIVLSGSINFSDHWINISETEWQKELNQNLNFPFFLARKAMQLMIKAGMGGKVILTGTESSLHGGSEISFPYAVAKRGTECLVQGLARQGAPHNILVNGLRMGYFKSGFHERWHNKTENDLETRANLVPLKRGGHPNEAAAMIIHLLSGYGQFITGQMIPLTGGDWL